MAQIGLKTAGTERSVTVCCQHPFNQVPGLSKSHQWVRRVKGHHRGGQASVVMCFSTSVFWLHYPAVLLLPYPLFMPRQLPQPNVLDFLYSLAIICPRRHKQVKRIMEGSKARVPRTPLQYRASGLVKAAGKILCVQDCLLDAS